MSVKRNSIQIHKKIINTSICLSIKLYIIYILFKFYYNFIILYYIIYLFVFLFSLLFLLFLFFCFRYFMVMIPRIKIFGLLNNYNNRNVYIHG